MAVVLTNIRRKTVFTGSGRTGRRMSVCEQEDFCLKLKDLLGEAGFEADVKAFRTTNYARKWADVQES